MSGKSFVEIAKSQGLVSMDTHSVVTELTNDILMDTYRPDLVEPEALDRAKMKKQKWSEAEIEAEEKRYEYEMERFNYLKSMNKKIEAAYKSFNGSDFEYDAKGHSLSMFLKGPPGQGKTTSFKVASKAVADMLGMNFVINPDDTYEQKLNDFLFVSLECSGENSAMTFGGMPSKNETRDAAGNSVFYMTKIANKRLALLGSSSAGLLLLDDFSNATPNVQNVALSITDEKRFQSLNLGHVTVGLTGNLGALDGTHTAKTSTALSSRVIPVFVSDNITNFIERTHLNYSNDSIGDAGMIAFLQRNPDLFVAPPDPKKSGGFPTSRTWDHYIQKARQVIARNGGRGRGEEKGLSKLNVYASAILGEEVGLKIQSYLLSMVQGADPIARAGIMENKNVADRIKEKYGEGKAATQQDFGYQLAVAAADYTVQKIKAAKNHDMTEAITNFAAIVLKLNKSEFAYSIDYLKAKLPMVVPQYVSKEVSSSPLKKLDIEAKSKIISIIQKMEDCDKDRWNDLLEIITDCDKLTATRRRTSR